jgi:hypothetical protein
LGFKLGPAGDTGVAVPGALKVNFQVQQYKRIRTSTVSMEISCVQTELSIVHMPKMYLFKVSLHIKVHAHMTFRFNVCFLLHKFIPLICN